MPTERSIVFSVFVSMLVTACQRKDPEQEPDPLRSSPVAVTSSRGSNERSVRDAPTTSSQPSAGSSLPAGSALAALPEPAVTPQSRGLPHAPAVEAPAPREPSPAHSAALPEPSGAVESPSPVPPMRGPTAKGQGFTAWLATTGGYTTGSPSTVRAVVEALAPFKCNEKYPYKLALDSPGPGLVYPTPVIRGATIAKRRATMDVPFRPVLQGKHRVSGVLSFSVCTEDRCLVERQPVSVVVEARP